MNSDNIEFHRTIKLLESLFLKHRIYLDENLRKFFRIGFCKLLKDIRKNKDLYEVLFRQCGADKYKTDFKKNRVVAEWIITIFIQKYFTGDIQGKILDLFFEDTCCDHYFFIEPKEVLQEFTISLN